MFPSSTRLTNTLGMFFRTSSNVSLKCFSKSSGVKVGTSPEHLGNEEIKCVKDFERFIMTYPKQTSLAPTKMVISFQSFFISMFEC